MEWSQLSIYSSFLIIWLNQPKRMIVVVNLKFTQLLLKVSLNVTNDFLTASNSFILHWSVFHATLMFGPSTYMYINPRTYVEICLHVMLDILCCNFSLQVHDHISYLAEVEHSWNATHFQYVDKDLLNVNVVYVIVISCLVGFYRKCTK